ncbi:MULTISPECIES: ABC transporter ATP-binding protein [unclassified Halorubrum]|uniref:ABC transporter ATP-binding protein n=1 Tax=unclassified Halorubrum TaxID=2642239 RepID=UPI000B983C8E|nr:MULTISPECIES: ABC transporter ATP-binding protein [unclassified Halorubrum]OYR42687.1 sugar ABC transporter ATP-binding protein [Halorubrum sp. Eb13]OYR52395.1 sugar ABC transporter ATP-binding protein [Halorubrum sp. Ea1]
MARVTLDTLRKEFDRGTIVAVDDLDLEIDDGEFVTVVGPSGCGKTTTLRMVAGLEEPTSGTVNFDDEDVTEIHATDRPVAMVFQNYALYPHKTVMENMAFGLKMSTDMTVEERHERVTEMAEMMGIADLLDDKPDELSGGQKQRVALGRAIAREPEVFLFDEPLSNLDAKLRTEMRAEIQKLQKEFGVTAMYVTHDQEEAMTMGDRLAILNDGKLQQVGEPTEVYENPVNEFVAGFIGSPSMNFIDVDVDTDGTTATIRDGDSGLALALSREYVAGHELEGGPYTLGIRPENIGIVEEPTGDETLTATVEVVEPIGSDNYVHLSVNDDFLARAPANVKPEAGDEVGVVFEEEHVHLFDAETGEDVFLTDEEVEAAVA